MTDLTEPLRFARCLNAVLQQEGGFIDHRRDPGGATNLGITIKTLARWRGEDLETAAGKAGLTITACRSFTEWDAHSQGRALAPLPPFTIERIAQFCFDLATQLEAVRKHPHAIDVFLLVITKRGTNRNFRQSADRFHLNAADSRSVRAG